MNLLLLKIMIVGVMFSPTDETIVAGISRGALKPSAEMDGSATDVADRK
jgi:hypothetical protein